ncbi:hypothetical protein NUU61_009461 [Penicillium alfredii]|uniref:Proteinase n=1 Tax=Penicillium alfredii TaxID=1506179 RepID=A0A9W9EN30_9EURO|nr:uncharacterized protein NUU61_009461 [Penicillium alfredii]KAJ5084882.1 hypothetical protein NUU61_009461 [Penicillium alfredii]
MDLKRSVPKPPPYQPSRWRQAARWGLSLIAAAVTLLAWPPRSFLTSPVPASVPFSWDQVTPSQSLEYHDCGDGLQCARLQVPMDYNRTDGRQFALAVARLPAKVPVTDPRYGGAVLINPGGPGGPGTLSAFLSGHNLQTIVDAETAPGVTPEDTGDKYFDIIGFDPRGVGASTPAVICFPNPMSQRNWELQMETEGMLGSGLEALQRNWQRAQALNQGCSTTDLTGAKDDEAFTAYLNTPLVAQDMVTLVERHGEWRGKQGQKARSGADGRYSLDKTRAIAERTQWRRGEEPLLYWGRSYGTVLGATFAALYPDRVTRAVLDGVVDMETYYEGKGPNPVVDADAVFHQFGHFCNAAGPTGCPFYIEGGPDAIQNAYRDLGAQLLNASMPVMASATHGPEVVTWTDLKVIERIAVYQPLLVFPILAEMIAELAKGNAGPIADFKHRRHFGVCPSSECSRAGPWSPSCARAQNNELYASAAILCSDADHLADPSIEEFQAKWDSLKVDSASLGDYWAHIHLSCVGWKAKAKSKFLGPWGGTTAHPMLFVSTTLDPVTPLRSAQKMSSHFPGSALLEQRSEGHTSVTAPSVCIAKSIRSYFQTGALPKSGTLCEADLKPLVGIPDQSRIQDFSSADRELFEVLMAEVERSPWT